MRLTLAAPSAGLILSFAAPVLAQTAAAPPGGDVGAQMQAMRAACADDIQKLCPDATSREDWRACMMQNRDKVSDTCKADRAAMRQKTPSTPGQ